MERVRAEAHTLRMDFRFHAGYSLLLNLYISIFSGLPFLVILPDGVKNTVATLAA
ncbi:hypothetical protein [Neisseria meningitidis serogroup B]|uniref:Uncharacterized protein n=1 Tax=Neisseria meningitidis serogroup B TaxID=491 RepID=A0A0H5QRL4_NEIMI|nr:hypothetical protein [Neisseria meningitidis serogroup B]